MRRRVQTQPISQLRKRFNVYEELIWSHYGTAILFLVGIVGVRISLSVAQSGVSPTLSIICFIVLPIVASIVLGVYTLQQTESRMKRTGL